jgi:hypothetical protein
LADGIHSGEQESKRLNENKDGFHAGVEVWGVQRPIVSLRSATPPRARRSSSPSSDASRSSLRFWMFGRSPAVQRVIAFVNDCQAQPPGAGAVASTAVVCFVGFCTLTPFSLPLPATQRRHVAPPLVQTLPHKQPARPSLPSISGHTPCCADTTKDKPQAECRE